MLIEVGLMFAAYYGMRVFELQKEEEEREAARKRALRKKRMMEAAAASMKEGVEIELPEIEEDKESIGPPKEDREAMLQHYSKMSLVSMALCGFRQWIDPTTALLSLGFYIYTAIPYMRDVEKALIKNKKVDVNVLFFIADTLTFAIGQYFTAAMGVFLMHSGKMTVENAKDMAEKMIGNVFSQLPGEVWRLRDGMQVKIPLEEICDGDTLVVYTGEVVPVDGTITEGYASIDQHALTGESQPVDKEIGDRVFASTLLVNGKIYIRVDCSGKETKVAQITEILFKATSHKSETQLKGEKWADEATLPMLGLSALVLPICGPVSTAVFINSHMGNRIRLLAPLITLNHISKASEKGILIKDGRAIELLSTVDTVLFDKTGTLTNEVPEIGEIISCNPFSKTQILEFAAAAESKFTHPIARAILGEAEMRGFELPDIDDAEYKVGYGVTVNLNGYTIRIGSPRFISERGIRIPKSVALAQQKAHEQGHTTIMVVVNDALGGTIELKPQIRPDVRNVVEELKALGIKHTVIVSGDHEAPTQKLAEMLGMDEYYANTLPEEKAKIVEDLQAKGNTVCFVGDGINDAIAMKSAHVSMSISGSASIATDMAEIIFMDGSLTKMCELFTLAKRLDKKLKKALKLTVAPGVFNLCGAFYLHYTVLTSLMINTFIASVGLKDALMPVDDETDESEGTNIDSHTNGRKKTELCKTE